MNMLQAVFYKNKTYTNLPTVAIAGRPNVGKSTLFNRFMNKRIAITDPTPGVTRDSISAVAFILDRPVTLVDTGGFKLEHKLGTTEEQIDTLVVERTLETLKKADLILLVLDAQKITPEDLELISFLRPYQKKVLVAVNKTEGGRLQEDAWNFLQYGFSDLVFISAAHGDNITQLATKIIQRLDFSSVKEIQAKKQPIKIAIMGKPNTGKSTLCNLLTKSKNSIVSNISGTTRDVIQGEFCHSNKDFLVLDTAGIRKKAKVKDNVEYYSVNRAIKTIKKADIVYLLIDAQEGISEQDKKICDLSFEKGCGIIFVLNKWDTQDKDKKTLNTAIQKLHFSFGQMSFAPVINISALKNYGIKTLLDTTLKMWEQLNRKIQTSALNMALKQWLSCTPPPAKKSLNFKFKYMVQTSVNPVAFLIFATRLQAITPSYANFLKNKIRQDLGFSLIPIKLDFKTSRQSWQGREQ